MIQQGIIYQKVCSKCGKEFQHSSINKKLCSECSKYKPKEKTPKSNLFKNDSEGLSYFLGYVCSDGSVNKNKNKIKVCSTDYEIIKQFYDRIQSKNEITSFVPRNGDKIYKTCYVLSIDSESVKYFLSLGLQENKDEQSLDNFSWMTESDKFHFLRGFLDGDGSIELKKSKLGYTYIDRVSFLCRLKMAESIKKFLLDCHEYKRDRNNRIPLVELSVSGLRANQLAKKLWSNSTIHLQRKYKKYLEGVRNDEDFPDTNKVEKYIYKVSTGFRVMINNSKIRADARFTDHDKAVEYRNKLLGDV